MASKFRRDERITSKNLVSYQLYDASGEIIDEGMAVTLNISRSGALIKTKNAFAVNAHLGLIVAVENDIVEVEGTIRHCEEEDGEYKSGIKFAAITDEEIKKLATHFPEILD